MGFFIETAEKSYEETLMKKYRLGAMFLFVIAAGIPLSVPAMPAMDIGAEQLMRRSGDLKASLNLNANQLLLWQQVEAKTHALLHIRQVRREHLQSALKAGIGDAKAELRDLSTQVEAEENSSVQEDKQLRELWLTMNDALDDNQRSAALLFLADALGRSAETGREAGTERQNGETRGRGAGRKKGGGMGQSM